ncbi:MAG: AmmeMemoRadiSam system protein A [Synergistaceae bacterium]|jgi:AmmeMemoRadiSam system protein A|nr:AmmeMemoRadiSam system protein A [Synergistaceae bacterium]
MNDKTDSHPYVRLARTTISRLLNGKPLHGEPPQDELPQGEPPSASAVDTGDDELWKIQRACFVSIKTLYGDLRGCIGTILPARPTLDLEIISNSIAASTRDPRFPPMKAQELQNVTLSVDVLSLPEPISDRGELDPGVWGVIVSRGMLRGVLLPDLEGVDTVEQQLGIAARKAGILRIDDAVTIERFRVDRYKER